MKGSYSYYVTYVDKIFSTNPFGWGDIILKSVDLSQIIHGINITISDFRLYHTYRLMENEDGTYDIDAALIKNEVCEALWDRKYKYEYKKQGITEDKLQEAKIEVIKNLSDTVVIIAWSETKLS